MRYARVENGVVAEIIELPQGVAPADAFHAEIAAAIVPCDEASAVEGWSYDGKAFKAPPDTGPLNAVPGAVSSAQAKIQLLRTPGSGNGKTLLDDVRNGVDAAGGEVAIWFTDARTWERNNPYVAQIGKSLKLKAADIDALFVAAAQIAA